MPPNGGQTGKSFGVKDAAAAIGKTIRVNNKSDFGSSYP